jgi:hypothetical protein
MAISDSQVREWLANNPDASDAEIASAARNAGVTADQLARVSNVSVNTIQERVAEATLGRAPNTLREQSEAGLITDERASISGIMQGDIGALGTYLRTQKQQGNKIDGDYIQQELGYSYDDLIMANGIALAQMERDKALSEGNTDVANQFTEVLDTQPPAVAYTQFIDYVGDDNLPHQDYRDNTGFTDAIGPSGDRIGDPGEYNKSGINVVGDTLKGYVKAIKNDPSLLALGAIAVANPALGSMLSAGTKLIEGEGLDTIDLLALAVNAPGIAENVSFAQTALGFGDLGAGMLTDQSIMNAFQNYGLEGLGTAELISAAGGSTLEAMQAIQDIPQTALNKLKEVPEIQSMIAGAPIDIQNDVLRGVAQGAIAAGGTAVLGGSGTDIAKAFFNQQNIDLGLEGIGKNLELAGAGMLSDLGFQYTGPDLADVNYDSLNNLSNVTLPNFGGINIPSAGTPLLGLPPYTGLDLADVNYDSLNNLSNINIGNLPDFNVSIPQITQTTDQTGGVRPIGQDTSIGVLLPTIPLPPLVTQTLNIPESPIIRGGRGMFTQDDEEVRRISDLLLAI